MWTGYYVTCNDYGVNIPVDTQVTSATSNTGSSTITLSNPVTFPAGTVNVIAEPGGNTENYVTKIDNPNSSGKNKRKKKKGRG